MYRDAFKWLEMCKRTTEREKERERERANEQHFGKFSILYSLLFVFISQHFDFLVFTVRKGEKIFPFNNLLWIKLKN